jgi:DNA modification methylase
MIQLRKGDCLELMKDIPDKSIDAIIADLPYGTTACKWDSIIPFEPLWEQYKRVIKDNGAIVLFGSQPFTSALVMSNPELYRYNIVWDKVNRHTGYGNAKKMPLRRHEDILLFYKNLPTYNPQMTVGKPYVAKRSGNKPKVYENGGLNPKDGVNKGTRYPISILPVKADVKTEMGKHPTQKPVALLEYLIKTYTNEGEVVLDNTMGSGTTGVACVNTNRNFIGMELDDKYFEIAKERIEKAIAEKERILFKNI